MTLTQIVDIPADRRVRFEFEVPREVTADKAYITIQVTVPVEEAQEKPKAANKIIDMTRAELDEFLKNAHTPHADALLGILSNVGDITVEQIREERLAKKYLEYFK